MKNVFLLLTGLFLATLISCYRSPNDTIFAEDLDMISTTYRNDVNYGAEYLTYALSDSFNLITNVEDVDLDVVNDPAFRANIKNAIARNMDAYGYQLLNDTANPDTPDVYIPVTIAYINSSGVNFTPIFMPGWGGGWGYPGYGWGGGWYYWGWLPTSYSYDQGSVILDWYDIKNRKPPLIGDTNWRVETVWNCAISGILQNSSDRERNEKISQAIDQGFEQSPYLKKN